MCPNSKHNFIINMTDHTMICKDCYLTINIISINQNEAFIKIIKRAERDWYIKQLES